MWAWVFSRLAEAYARRYGLDYAHLARIAELNVANAAANPLAQTRAWGLSPEVFSEDDHLNPLIEPWVRRNDCGKVTDGGAGVVLASARAAAEHVARAGQALEDLPRIEGWAMPHRRCSSMTRCVAAPISPKSCRMFAGQSRTPGAARASAASARSTASRRPTASRSASTSRSTTSA